MTELSPMGVEFWEGDDEWERVNWYKKLTKCNNATSEVTCKPIKEINEYIEGMVLKRFLNEPIVDIKYLDNHLHDPLPFEIGEYKNKRHLLQSDELVFLSTTMQKAEVTIDHDLIISDLRKDQYTIHQVSEEEVYGPDIFSQGEFGDDVIFLWEFKLDLNKKRTIEIKYYALD